ncbi:hypothetical protein A3J90_01930 [candidate division WOR-1 bacterium RIFOXYC2_FULL_37_10]|uniref:RCC1-like domain-containing protein n=1 Tax=candidate division WOR-1 bacterium RIFOXYB2_FULL_37_13 TaxID=1802579 RepID=A0A1F4SU94_UNCSA|nr:MAG: hypothetical protein A2310_05640 [candidate division WOR-1 bacterium RIFOXYB2_FULL_37_13]OGC33914.1 MAG: hypothetical protein A3J90_01930 [candidate division WOR-1 bacterium RIFOXYC2_FULL_37_10]
MEIPKILPQKSQYARRVTLNSFIFSKFAGLKFIFLLFIISPLLKACDGCYDYSNAFQKIETPTTIPDLTPTIEPSFSTETPNTENAERTPSPWLENLPTPKPMEDITPSPVEPRGQTFLGCGGRFSVALKTDGTVWVWGSNTEQVLGPKHTEEEMIAYAIQVEVPEVVTAIAAGDLHILALTKDGNVYAWGNNDSGQLGTGSVGGRHPNPTKVNLPFPVVAIAAGTLHSLAVDKNGNVWVWGHNLYGELGRPSDNDGTEPSPIRIVLPPKIKAVAVVGGLYFSLVISSDGTVFSCGLDNLGQLGTNLLRRKQARPSEIFYPYNFYSSHILYAASGKSHSIVLDSNGIPWAWGKNNYGQLGIQTETSCSDQACGMTPGRLDEFLIEVSTSSDTTAALTSSHKIVVWGEASWLISEVEDFFPNHIKICGYNYDSWGLASSGSYLYSWGGNDSQQLGHEGENIGLVTTDTGDPFTLD